MTIRLEPLADRHVDGIAAMLTDRDALRFTRIPEPPPPDFPRTWVERYVRARRDGTGAGWAIVDGASAFLGVALAPTVDRDAREVELGYIVAARARGRGIATAALRQLTEWAFADAGALRVALTINADNHASLRVAERCGYVREGRLRSTHLKADVRVDVEIWSRLPTDPPPPPPEGR